MVWLGWVIWECYNRCIKIWWSVVVLDYNIMHLLVLRGISYSSHDHMWFFCAKSRYRGHRWIKTITQCSLVCIYLFIPSYFLPTHKAWYITQMKAMYQALSKTSMIIEVDFFTLFSHMASLVLRSTLFVLIFQPREKEAQCDPVLTQSIYFLKYPLHARPNSPGWTMEYILSIIFEIFWKLVIAVLYIIYRYKDLCVQRQT